MVIKATDGTIKPIPPIVGVPLFFICQLGPSPYIGCFAFFESQGISFLVNSIVDIDTANNRIKYKYVCFILFSYLISSDMRPRFMACEPLTNIISSAPILLLINSDILEYDGRSFNMNIRSL